MIWPYDPTSVLYNQDSVKVEQTLLEWTTSKSSWRSSLRVRDCVLIATFKE